MYIVTRVLSLSKYLCLKKIQPRYEHSREFPIILTVWPYKICLILGQMWYLIVSIPDPCCLSYFH